MFYQHEYNYIFKHCILPPLQQRDILIKTWSRPCQTGLHYFILNVWNLLFQKLCTGMILLGCVKEIKDYELILGLANGQQGVVSIVDIGDAYRNLLQKFTDLTNSGEIDSYELVIIYLHIYYC